MPRGAAAPRRYSRPPRRRSALRAIGEWTGLILTSLWLLMVVAGLASMVTSVLFNWPVERSHFHLLSPTWRRPIRFWID